MQVSELSILIPAKNIENEITQILSFAAKQAEGLNVEFIIVDMGSGDKTVLQAVTLMKDLSLHGFVIQNGSSSVAAALNTAVQKAGSEYLSFLFARRLYVNFLPQYLEVARRSNADLVFGCTTKEEARVAERRAISSAIRQPDGSRFVKDALRRKINADIACVIVRRQFLMAKQICFEDNCIFGYAEEFILRCMLAADSVVQAPVLLRRDETYELKRGKQNPAGLKIFQKVEAALRVLDAAKSNYGSDPELLRLLEKEIIPSTVINAINVMLLEGNSTHMIKSYMDVSGYDRLLSTDRRTDPALRRRIFLWKTTPWLYRP